MPKDGRPEASGHRCQRDPRHLIEPQLPRRNPAQMTAWLDENCGADGWA
jgi:hypothetical protein